jgi:hypothetical protein
MAILSQLAGGFPSLQTVHCLFSLIFPENALGFPKGMSHTQHIIGVHLAVCLPYGRAIAQTALIASSVSYGGVYAKHSLV